MKRQYLYLAFLGAVLSPGLIFAQMQIFLDVLVVIPQDTISAEGSESAARAFAASRIEQANSIYAASGTQTRLRMIGAITVPQDVSGMTTSQQVNFLTNNAKVLAARARYGADLVTMIASGGPDTTVYGQASNIPTWSQRNNVSALRAASYSVTRLANLPRDRFTYAHEVGHSLGAAHNVSSISWANYSFGYGISSGGQARNTVLGFSDHTASNHRLPRLSNPNQTYSESPWFSNVPIGTASNNNSATFVDSTPYVNQVADPFVFWNSTVDSGEWRNYSWWNWFNTSEYPWVYHLHHGWLWVDGASNVNSNLVYWDYRGGGWFTLLLRRIHGSIATQTESGIDMSLHQLHHGSSGTRQTWFIPSSLTSSGSHSRKNLLGCLYAARRATSQVKECALRNS